MYNSIVMVGQFPPPITGEAVANIEVKSILEGSSLCVRPVDSCIVDDVSEVGSFSLRRLVHALIVWLRFVPRLLASDYAYFTPGQTRLGLLRFLPMMLLASLFAKKTILHWHGYGIINIARANPKIGKLIFSRRFHNIVLTEDLANSLRSEGFDGSNMSVVRNYVDAPQILPGSPIAAERLRVLYLGSLMTEKGIDTFLETAKANDRFDFFVCGSGSAEAIRLVRKADTEGSVRYLGVVEGAQKHAIFQECDIFVLQTHYPTEGVPLSLLEAMAHGCAIVTTRHNGIPETVQDAAVFVSAESVSSLSKALDLLHRDRARLDYLKRRALDQAQRYTYSEFKNSILRIFSCD